MRALSVASQLVTVVLQVWIVTLLVKRKLAKRFPWFLAFILYQICEGIVRWSIYSIWGNGRIYFAVYWTTEPFDVLLSVCALGESFLQIFKPLTKVSWFRWLFWNCLALTLAYWLWQSWAHPPTDTNWMMSIILQMDLTAVYVPIVIAMLYFGLAKFFKVTQHQRQSGIILGLAINAVSEVGALVPRSIFGARVAMLIGWIPPLGYILAEIIWVHEFVGGEAPADPRLAKLKPGEVRGALEEHIKTFKELGGKRR